MNITSKVGECMTIEEVLSNEERQIFDRKSINIEPKALAVPLIAFANADGGTIAIGISDKTRRIEGTDFEDVIRTAVSLGGDCDTLTCIAGGMAEAFYGVDQSLIDMAKEKIPKEFVKVLTKSKHYG